MKVLYGVCSWGLGHATRSLPIMRKLIAEGNELTIVSHGRSLELLKMELGESAKYVDCEDYPLPYTEKSKVFLLRFCWFAPRLIKSMIAEHKKIVKYVDSNKFDIIISDNRYGVFHRNVPSFFITHQLRVIAPARIKLIENSWEKFNYYFQNYFQNIMVPDYEENGISGDLSHNLNLLNSKKVVYFGIMSDFKKASVSEDVDFLFSISGPEPQRQVMEDLIIDQLNNINGKIVLSLGRKLDDNGEKKMDSLNSNIKLYPFLPGQERELLMNKSKIIVSRSGYSTLMDVYALDKKALFVPTPQQTEQQYLAKYHEEMGNFLYVNQEEINLQKDLEKAKRYRGPDKHFRLDKNIEKFMDTIYA
jgi:uncharacterized protein (TIGR00661 family)